MAEQHCPDKVIYGLDNLDVLSGTKSETVDLIATDPPFNTKQVRHGRLLRGQLAVGVGKN